MDLDFDDEEAQFNDYYADCTPALYAWLYIAIDIREMGLTKIGLTTKQTPQQRIAEGKTYNPFLTLFTVYELSKCSKGTSRKELSDIERYIHSRSVFGEPIKHLDTGRDSEWFPIHPEEAEAQVDWILARRGFSVGGKNLYSNAERNQMFNGIDVQRMRQIKRIFRPCHRDLHDRADKAGMDFHDYRDYYAFLQEFHARDAEGKIYL